MTQFDAAMFEDVLAENCEWVWFLAATRAVRPTFLVGAELESCGHACEIH